jgi:hypothetical protein
MRIATFNLESFGKADRRSASLAERAVVLRPQLERLKADILCLQEVDAPKVAGLRRPVDLERLLAGTSYTEHRLVVSTGPTGATPADVHNLAVLTRLRVVEASDLRHDLVEPPRFRRRAALPPDDAPVPLSWDRPLQHLVMALPDGRRLHVFNVHLRAPLAAAVPGQKAGPFAWKSISGWAEGFFMAAVKRAGQALELRLAIERVFDAEPRGAHCSLRRLQRRGPRHGAQARLCRRGRHRLGPSGAAGADAGGALLARGPALHGSPSRTS